MEQLFFVCSYVWIGDKKKRLSGCDVLTSIGSGKKVLDIS